MESIILKQEHLDFLKKNRHLDIYGLGRVSVNKIKSHKKNLFGKGIQMVSKHEVRITIKASDDLKKFLRK